MNGVRKLWEHGKDLLPIEGFSFDRPLVLFQSDDWGRVGVRDQEGWEELRSKGISLGERPYDFYALETAEDLDSLNWLLKEHRDSSGRHPCIQMNFILCNLDFSRIEAEEFRCIHLRLLADGLPEGWKRPGLVDAYREGIRAGVFVPALHGATHFCRPAVDSHMRAEDDHGDLLRTLWQAGTPYIHWRMPWIGYEYWDPGMAEDERFLSFERQREFIGAAVGGFAKMFSTLPRSACAPGYRANKDTQRAWAQHGIRVVQNGPGTWRPPFFENEILHLSRNVEFEPATDAGFSVERCIGQAEKCFERGLPAIVSLHSINFHSTLRNFRIRTLDGLKEFLSVLESRHPDLVYLRDEELLDLIRKGKQEGRSIRVTKKMFTKAGTANTAQA